MRFWRILHGQTLDAVATETGIDRTTLSRIERGLGIPTKVVQDRLEIYYDASFNYLSRHVAEIPVA
jgi:transcriptional regulator with XRE-family HTH domain